MPVYFDTHVHFDMMKEGGPAAVIERAISAGVEQMIAVGGSPSGNRDALSLAAEFTGRIYAAVGYDRDGAEMNYSMEDLETSLQEQQDRVCLLALGEIGLDFHYNPESAKGQCELFGQQLELARRHDMPVIVHSREADEATISLLKEHRNNWTGDSGRIGVLHCFTGEQDFARRVLDLGFHIGVSGIVTFRNACVLRGIVKFVPEDRLLLETDSPFLAPVPRRGRLNEPAYLPYVAGAVANARESTVEHVAEVTTRNARRLFGIWCSTAP